MPSAFYKNKIGKAAIAALGTGAAIAAYAGVIEPRLFTVCKYTLPLLPPEHEEIKILHLSDIHMHGKQKQKVQWLQSLAQLKPDILVNTGDNLTSHNGIDKVKEGLSPFFPSHANSFPIGFYVWGSNDYFAPTLKNPFKYFSGPSQHPKANKKKRSRLDTKLLNRHFSEAGWINANNKNGILTVKGTTIAFTGTNDPHIGYDRYIGYPIENKKDYDIKLGITHAPYQRILNEMTEDDTDLILAGHTHGGQVNLPFYGPLVSNCDLPAQQAKGLTKWRYKGKTSDLEVSAGIGASLFAPYRLACRPEATLLKLVSR